MSDTPDPYSSPGANGDQPSHDPAQPPSGEPSPYPGQPYSGQSSASQPYPDQPYSGQPYSGQPYANQPYANQPYANQPYPGQPAYSASYPGYGQQRGTDGFAIGALVSGIAGVTVLPFVGSIVAVVLGIVALNRIKASGQEGRGMAIAGIVLGGVGIALAIVAVVVLIAIFAAVGPGEWQYYRDVASIGLAI